MEPATSPSTLLTSAGGLTGLIMMSPTGFCYFAQALSTGITPISLAPSLSQVCSGDECFGVDWQGPSANRVSPTLHNTHEHCSSIASHKRYVLSSALQNAGHVPAPERDLDYLFSTGAKRMACVDVTGKENLYCSTGSLPLSATGKSGTRRVVMGLLIDTSIVLACSCTVCTFDPFRPPIVLW